MKKFYDLSTLYGIEITDVNTPHQVTLTAHNTPKKGQEMDSFFRTQVRQWVTDNAKGAVTCTSTNGTDFVVRPVQLAQLHNIVNLRQDAGGAVHCSARLPSAINLGTALLDITNREKITQWLNHKPMLIVQDKPLGQGQHNMIIRPVPQSQSFSSPSKK